jgi:hypothetical protein
MRGRYLEPAVAVHILDGHDGRWVCTLTDVTFIDEDGSVYVAPAGTLTDFASVPRIVWAVFPKMGKHNRAAVMHDAHCAEQRLSSPTVHAIFRRGLKACGCSRATVFWMWFGVRAFGPRFSGA